jgi:biopolymer transport protein ExbD
MTDINITPFTDVVLVLLIVFMVATPALYESNLKVELPRGTTPADDTSKDVVVTIDADGGIYLDDRRVSLEDLGKAMLEMTAAKEETRVIVNGDRNVKYDSVIDVMDALARAGVKSPGLGIELKR